MQDLHPLKKTSERTLFFKRLIHNPKALGAFVPSSRALGSFIAQASQRHPTPPIVVELGAGTGGLTRALLAAGQTPENLYIVEQDPELYAYLTHKFQGIHIFHGDANHLSTLLPTALLGQVDLVISGIPMMNLSPWAQRQIVTGAFQIMRPEGRLLQFTYGPFSPLPSRQLGLRQNRLGHVLKNFPPAVVWEYQQAAHSQEEYPFTPKWFRRLRRRVN